ncbi:MAG TPA: aminopeptidase N [Streptosporangiaceae bacterium]
MDSNLTRDEARERARLLTVDTYQVDLDLTSDEATFSSAVSVSFSCSSPGASSFIDLTAPELIEATLNGAPLGASTRDGAALDGAALDKAALQHGRIALPDLAASNELRVVARCAYSRTGDGLHRFTDPADERVYLYTDFETSYAQQVFACFDQPDLKATFEFTVTCPDDWLVVSNAAPAAAGEPAGPGRSRWRFPPTRRIPTYITAIAAGPYHVERSEHDGIPLGIYCRQSLASYLDPDEIFEITRQGFDYFHRAFGVRYQFGKYDQLFVPEYKSGAMENAGAVTFLEDYIFRSRVTDAARERRGDTILHEMAHMWFGDMVTTRWWDDLWLNESFASWAAVSAQSEATRWTGAWTTFTQGEKAWAYRQDQLPSTHPIAADIPDIAAVEVNFDGITYAKGAAVLRQLVSYVGRDNFLAGVRAYFARHAWGNATLSDLLAELEQASGRELSQWSKAWLETAGVNTLRPQYQTDAQGAFTEFAVLQEAPESHPQLRPHRIGIGLYDRTSAGLVRRHRVEADVAGERTEIAELRGQRRPDLILVNDDDLTFAKIRLDEHSMRTLVSAIGEFGDSMPAALCWAAAWDMCRDAELPARDYVSLVLSGISSVSDIAVLQAVLMQAAAAARRYCDPAARAGRMQQLATALREQLRAAEPGSDRQLAFTQALAGVATSDADTGLLSGLLDSTVQFEGLTVDTDLRWQLLRRLVSRGAAGPASIEAELAADPTDAGQRQAARCRAAIPDPQAKQAAWDEVVSAGLPNAVFRATLLGFADQDADELLAPYLDRYFTAVPGVWQTMSPDMAQFFTEVAYPAWVVTPAAIKAADDLLAAPDLPVGLRRLVSERRDDVARALRCRERDASAS